VGACWELEVASSCSTLCGARRTERHVRPHVSSPNLMGESLREKLPTSVKGADRWKREGIRHAKLSRGQGRLGSVKSKTNSYHHRDRGGRRPYLVSIFLKWIM